MASGALATHHSNGLVPTEHNPALYVAQPAGVRPCWDASEL